MDVGKNEITPVRCQSCTNAGKLDFHFDYAYQPIVDVRSGKAFAHEALVRGANGEGASTVLDRITEENQYRFDQACRVKAVEGAARLGIKENISINFLPNAVYRPEVCIRTTLAAARANNFPVERIIFEVTEGERINDGPWFAEILREYKKIGFQTAIDDFGAGYAGLKLLSDFQPDFVKIDMDLIRNVHQSRARKSIVRGICEICVELDILVIAEGIEDKRDRDFLRDVGIYLMQGFLFAKPAFRGVAAIDPNSLL